MKRLLVVILATVVLASVAAAGCGQASPAAAPTQAAAQPKAAEPTKASEPTKPAQAAQPTWPAKDKTITIIVPWATGGANDISSRLVAGLMEKDLGVPVQVVNKAGAGSQIGLTEIANAKPDGYTIGLITLPSAMALYLDPERNTTFNRKSFVPLALLGSDPGILAVAADSPYKTLKDLVADAKTKPGQITVGCSGPLNANHLMTVDFERATGTKYGIVQFPAGGQEIVTAVLGGHVVVVAEWAGTLYSQVNSGNLRALAVMDKEKSKYLPNAPLISESGYDVLASTSRGLIAPAGTPKEAVAALSAAINKAMTNDGLLKKMEEAGITVRYMDATQFGTFWDESETRTIPLIKLAKQ